MCKTRRYNIFIAGVIVIMGITICVMKSAEIELMYWFALGYE